MDLMMEAGPILKQTDVWNGMEAGQVMFRSVAVWFHTRVAAPPRSCTEVIGAARLPSSVPSEGSVSWAPAAGTVMQ